MALGGKREGAGRKKGHKASHTIEAEAAKARIIARVSQRVDELVDMLFEKAIDSKDVSAIKELLDRAFGRPMQAVEMSNPDGEEFAVSLSVKVSRLIDDYTNKKRETPTS